MTATLQADKSTNVRHKNVLLRAGGITLRALEEGSPAAAAAVAEKLLFRTMRIGISEARR